MKKSDKSLAKIKLEEAKKTAKRLNLPQTVATYEMLTSKHYYREGAESQAMAYLTSDLLADRLIMNPKKYPEELVESAKFLYTLCTPVRYYETIQDFEDEE